MNPPIETQIKVLVHKLEALLLPPAQRSINREKQGVCRD
jgi:hypothetical protein